MTNDRARCLRPLLPGWLLLRGMAACAGDVQHDDGAASALAQASCALDAGPATTPDGGTSSSADDAGSASYQRVREIIARSCAYHRCHAGPVQGGGLNFAAGVDYRSQLVNVQSCGYDRMMEVEPFAPERSWLMVKLTADARPLDDPYATYIYFDPPADWDPTKRRCVDQTDDGKPLFGQRMPATAPNMLPPDELEAIRAWIAEGAPP